MQAVTSFFSRVNLAGSEEESPFKIERTEFSIIFKDVDANNLLEFSKMKDIMNPKLAYNPNRANVYSEVTKEDFLREMETKNLKEIIEKNGNPFQTKSGSLEIFDLFLVLLSQRHELYAIENRYPRTYFMSLDDKNIRGQPFKVQIRDYDRILVTVVKDKSFSIYCFNIDHKGEVTFKDGKINIPVTVVLLSKKRHEETLIWTTIKSIFKDEQAYTFTLKEHQDRAYDYDDTLNEKNICKACSMLTEISSNVSLSPTLFLEANLLPERIIKICILLGSIIFHQPQDSRQNEEVLPEPFITEKRLELIEDIYRQKN